MKMKPHIATVLVAFIALSAYAKRVPNLEFKDLGGHGQKLASVRGSITVLSFWATWCAPCREELPRLSKLNSEYAGKGVRFLAISIDEAKDRAKIEPFLRQQNITLDVWLGGDVDMLDRVGLGNIVPGTLVIDKDGEIIGRIMGEAQEPDIRGRLDWLLQDRKGPAPEPLTKRY
jgi:thiol-disulfide isomerase/thioredoxin